MEFGIKINIMTSVYALKLDFWAQKTNFRA